MDIPYQDIIPTALSPNLVRPSNIQSETKSGNVEVYKKKSCFIPASQAYVLKPDDGTVCRLSEFLGF